MNSTQLTALSGVWKPATDLQKMSALILLAKLPMRNQTDLVTVKAVYFIALEGVTAFGLEQATRAIMRGSLKHAFMPSPPELRMECERIMDAEREKLMRSSRLEWPEDHDETKPPDDAARQRMHERWMAVRPMFEPPKPEDPAIPKTIDERLADLREYGSQPFDVSPALLRRLEARRKLDIEEEKTHDGRYDQGH